MFFEKTSVFFVGRIYFSAKGGFDALFLEECRNLSIKVYDIAKTEECINGSVKNKDIKFLMKAASKSGMEIEILARYGFPYIFYKYRKRIGIPIGLLFASIIVAFLSSMIWSVEIRGEINIPNEEIIKILERNGVSKGSFVDTVQCRDVEFALYEEIEQLSWVSVYIAGSRVFVEIKERPETVGIEERSIYSNIIASKDGEIVRANIYQGEGELYPGTAVQKGDLLVSGTIKFADETEKQIRAKADIYARTYTHINSSTAKRINASRIVENKNRFSVYFFGLILPWADNDDQLKNFENKYLFESLDIVFPVGTIRNNFMLLENSEIMLTDRQALLIAFYDYSESSMFLYKNSEVLEREINIIVDSQITIESKYLCIENIAEEKIITATADNSK